MTEELANIDLLKSGSDGPGSLAPRSRRLLAIVAFLAIVIVLLGAGYFWLRRGRAQPASPAAAPPDAAVKVFLVGDEEERVRRARGMGRAVLARNPVRWLTTQLRDLDAAAGITSQGPQDPEESGWPLHEEIGGTQ